MADDMTTLYEEEVAELTELQRSEWADLRAEFPAVDAALRLF